MIYYAYPGVDHRTRRAFLRRNGSMLHKVDPETIIEIVAKFYNVDRFKLSLKRRDRDIVFPRQMAMYFLKLKTNLSLQSIGLMFGGRDHTTVIHSVQRLNDLADVYPEVEGDIKELTDLINEA